MPDFWKWDRDQLDALCVPELPRAGQDAPRLELGANPRAESTKHSSFWAWWKE